MLSGVPNASWHPALMPNSIADIPRSPPTELSSSFADDHKAEDTAELFPENDVVEDSHSRSLGPDSWFPDYGTGDNWIGDANNAEAPAEHVSHDDVADATGNEIPDVSSEISKHTSRMSFARTVSHEVNWMDDDDPEWNLTRTGTDPFKAMPQSNRTNSFPAVPPLDEHQGQNELEQPLPSDETEEIMKEIEQEENHDASVPFDGAPEALEGNFFDDINEDDNISHQWMGGDLHGTNEEASEARYAEGLPLISGQDNAPQEDNAKGGNDPFGDQGAAEEDDFFSQVRESESTQLDDHAPQLLERKSTMQVLDSLDMGSQKADVPTLEESAEEEEETSGALKADHQGDAREDQAPDATVVDEEVLEAAGGEDLDAKWKEMFASDDEDGFLLDESSEAKEDDTAAFLPSDDEGFLDDSADEQPGAETDDGRLTPTAPAAQKPPATQNERYLPSGQMPSSSSQPTNSHFPTVSAPVPATSNQYLPATATPGIPVPAVTPFSAPATVPPVPAAYGYGAPRPTPQVQNKAQSFADKAKGGYQSPYDLPMEVVKPKKRQSLQNLQRPMPGSSLPTPGLSPLRSASMNAPLPPPPGASPAIPSQATFSNSAQPPPTVKKPPPASRGSFFEELPIAPKPRPTSRHSNKGLASPSQTTPYSPPPPPLSGPPPLAQQHFAPQIPPVPSQPVAEIPALVAPPPPNPYASLPSNASLSPTVPAATATRYSPAPPGAPQGNGSAPPPPPSRYSPAPPVTRQASAGYAPSTAASAPPILPHQPRTSSPLAHFEISHDKSRAGTLNHSDGSAGDRRSSSSMYDPRLQRVPSLPPTREVEEEGNQDQAQTSAGYVPTTQQVSPPGTRHGQLPYRPRQTPPPPSYLGQSTLSPSKRATSSHNSHTTPQDFAPPLRSQTQSPGALYGSRNGKPIEATPRPSSVHDPTPPRSTLATAPQHIADNSVSLSTVSSRPRGFSQNFNLVAPTDGRENDPLQRWRGAPLFSWGVGGTTVTMFPKNVPRYGMTQTAPMVMRSPGEVRIKNVKDITPLEERLANFPGPLKGKSKKKDTIAWLSTGIESLERALPNPSFAHQHASHDDKRAVERVLLWKILRLFVEHDGTLEGSPAVEKAVRAIMAPDVDTSGISPVYLNPPGGLGLDQMSTNAAMSDAVDSSAVALIRKHLLSGDAEKAVWSAVDKRLWGHALLLANALAPALYKQVAQEFVKKEVNIPGHNNESLATLYEVLSGNHEECVDELVPVYARAGLQLVDKNTASGTSKDVTEGLDKWHETLALILSNRSNDDGRAINSLGNLLSGYGRAEAGHICFLFARKQTVFGGLDDPASNFVLLGSDHKQQAEHFAREVEPLLLSEVYEYGQSLAGTVNVPITNPHLAAYKLHHAIALAEYGFVDKALQYCEAISAAITAQTRRSPYHHPILEAAVEDLMTRLKQAPREESSSWIPKPSMNKVSDTMWTRFNKFVAGDENDGSGQGSPKEESGPFARVAGGTPTISRPPSTNNLETFGATVPSYGIVNALANGPTAAVLSTSAPTTRAASRYAPGAVQPAVPGQAGSYEPNSTYAPRSSMDRTSRSSTELNRSSFEMPRQSSEVQPGYSAPYALTRTSSPSKGYTSYQNPGLSSQESSYMPVSQPSQASQASLTSQPQFSMSSGYEPLGCSGPNINGSAPHLETTDSQTPSAPGYQPPSYGYEPPALASYESPAADNKASGEAEVSSSFEPPSYQPYGYKPPSFESNSQPANDDDSDEDSKPKPKKKGIMYDDDEDDFGTKKPVEKSKEEKDKENAELFRKAAEEDAKRTAEAKQAKKGWGFGGWFGGGGAKKEAQEVASANPNKPIRAKLGEANSFYYDPEKKRWVNKNSSPEDSAAKTATPPPPRSSVPPRSAASSPAPPMTSPPMPIPGAEAGRASAPPVGPPPRSVSMGMTPPPPSNLGPPATISENGNNGSLGPPSMMRSVSNTSSAAGGPPSRPTTSLSNSSSIDDLLAAAGPRKAGAKKPRKSARYVDVMTK
ncbi:Sec23-binding domain of Sec16-domain-containing protein [Apodospora peruviana]|uniref:Protein transport protein sec16 n=1 Tax=Apodospora peruviana TaxID=516989 RepID=A0AAE0IHW4_9PEZI|nr:Sec23-binding domain of Sec16-domain-containing protein [Apodospora peruviana]